tara:strand:- start:30273 stop:30671 length:399 start_codon:yes stop_codon:yes gene_type:complete
MAIFGNSTALANTTPMNGRAKKPAAKFWLNFGYRTADPETNEPVFIGMPMGIPLDTQEKRSAGASMLMQAKNAFLDKVLSDCESMTPGQELYLEVDGGYCLQLRRVAEREEATADNNGFIAAMGSLGGFKAA